MGYGIRWPSPGNYGGVNFHGMFMSTAMVFFQGEALLSYRFYRYDAKVLSKFVHVVFHLMAIAFFSTALSAIIIHKNKSNLDHFTSVHSWIGITVMFVYVVQFAFGFVNFLFSGITESTRKTFMPMHRIVGCLLFAASLVQAVIGFVQYNGFYGNCPQEQFPGSRFRTVRAHVFHVIPHHFRDCFNMLGS
ncbi:hypothetical protein Y032_0051g2132 [Ancylostoma ceylanicum]|uniref:Cytochrome b561 domain-containing protein n=1 Tax=Ancylostoma ceylanicum TaxID=53326 RepID=A0A016U7K3_9BILA|nr:hypothetical protein Y032_0051g2132 [Ancylostoma ceylanicum]